MITVFSFVELTWKLVTSLDSNPNVCRLVKTYYVRANSLLSSSVLKDISGVMRVSYLFLDSIL